MGTVETVLTVLIEDLKKYHSLTDNLKARDASASKNQTFHKPKHWYFSGSAKTN